MRAALLLLTACSFKGPGGETVVDAAADGGVVDASTDGTVPTDGQVDASTTGFCYGHNGYRYCFATAPTGDPVFGAGVVNVDTNKADNKNCTSVDGGICFVAVNSLTVTGTIVFKGPNPVVIIAVGDMTIAGTLDATAAGPPSAAGCNAGTKPSGDGAGGGGGAGGSFRASGADGGKGGNSIGGVHGDPLAGPPAKLQAGCAGAKGGDGQMQNGGDGGHGGGGIVLISGGSLTISGNVVASGTGGGGGKHAKSGGGGGGSGGVLVVDAASYTMTGRLYANGAGGGGGAGPGDDGMPGKTTIAGDPVTNVPTGGTGGTAGGSGGAGSALGTLAMNGTTAVGGGAGGGGGSVGFILAPQGAPTIGWKTSPDVQPLP